MLKYQKIQPYIPAPTRSKPLVTAEHKKLAAQVPPTPVPFHCKPWVDGQSVGWTLYYGFLTPITIRGREDGKIAVDNLDQLSAETNQPKVIDQFSPSHFGINCGLTLQTPPGFVSLIIPCVTPPQNLDLLTAVIETDWYPRQIFLVYSNLKPGQTATLDYQTPFARVVVIPRHDGLQAQAMTPDEQSAIQQSKTAYVAEEAASPTRWTDAFGNTFTHVYKLWSRKFRSSFSAETKKD